MKKADVVRDVKKGVQYWYYDAHWKHEGVLISTELDTRCRYGLIVDNESIP
jgi:hypothetical protein